MSGELKILFLEDNEDDVVLIQRALRKSNFIFSPQWASNKEKFISSLQLFSPDIILSDHTLPQFDSLSALGIVKEKYPHIPFILVTGSVSEEFAVKCIKSGAEDYVLKNNLVKLPSIIESAINKKDLKAENNVIKNLNSKLREANEIIAQKNKDITDSINYALSLQEALMQKRSDLRESNPESFILLLPKQTLSGDFYWFKNIDGCSLVAAVDCTGHGVPGALLTVMGMNILHAAALVHKIYSPPSIVKFLDEDLNRKLSHKTGLKAVNDGMDIAICEIDRNKMMLTVSGANRSMCLIRDGEIQLITTDKYSIGSAEPAKQFGCKYIPIKKDDIIYMFTDGFQDQFGGKDKKKMGSGRFRELLLSLSKEDFNRQKNLLRSSLTEWQGDEEQTDDILVIGIKV